MPMTSSAMRGLDAWLTREPDWEWDSRFLPRCGACGGFLKHKPERTEQWEDKEHCTGEPDPDYGTACEGWGGTGTKHEPHDFVVAGGEYLYRTCARCGAVDKEMTY